MSNYLAHAIGVKATHNLPIQSDVMSPKGRYVKNDDHIHIYWMLNGRWSEDTTISKYHRQPNGDYVFDGVSVELFKDTIKRQGNFECNQRNIRALWDDARLTQMARNMLNQAQSALAQISNQLNMRHSAIDIIDVSDTIQHSQHEGYYSPNNTANKVTPYIFEKLVKSSAGNQIGARFKGQGDRQWVEIFVPTVDFTPNMQNFIALFNAEKGNVKIREEEMRKAARLLTNFFNSPSLPGNEKMTTYVRKPKSLKHSLFTEIYDMDDYLEHHGILGMKWGVRRYQNEDGSLTKEGRDHYKIKGARFKERYKGNYELALKNANDARKAAIEKAKEGKNGASFLNTAYHQQNLADRYAKKLDKKSQGLVSFEKNKETEKLGKEIYEYYKDKPTGKFVAEAIVGSTAASLASFGLSAALGLPLFMVFATEPNRYELKDDKK